MASVSTPRGIYGCCTGADHSPRYGSLFDRELDVGQSERQSTNPTLRFQPSFGGEQADTGPVALNDRLMIEIGAGGSEVAGREDTQFVTVGALEHGAIFRARMLVPRLEHARGHREHIDAVFRRMRCIYR